MLVMGMWVWKRRWLSRGYELRSWRLQVEFMHILAAVVFHSCVALSGGRDMI